MKSTQNLLPELVSLGTYKSPPGGSRNPAIAPKGHLLIEIIQEGSVYGVAAQRQLHGEGSVFCHGPLQKSVSDSPEDSYYHCAMATFKCGKHALGQWPRFFEWSDVRAMHALLEELLYEFHQNPAQRLYIGHLLWSRLALEQGRFQSREKLRQGNPQLRMACDFINTRYAEMIALENIAAAAHISVSHLHMLFRQHLGESPHQYLVRRRMRAASHLLATSDSPIKAVAADVGYLNTESFCRAFRAFFDTSASAYRQAYTLRRD